MKIVEKCFAKKWLYENNIGLVNEDLQDSSFDDVYNIELANSKISFATKSLDDFIFACIVKNRVPYAKFPLKHKYDIKFLSNVCYAMPSILNEIFIANPVLFTRIIEINKTFVKSSFLNKEVRKAIKKVKTFHKTSDMLR